MDREEIFQRIFSLAVVALLLKRMLYKENV
jgi:hypothetical protein